MGKKKEYKLGKGPGAGLQPDKDTPAPAAPQPAPVNPPAVVAPAAAPVDTGLTMSDIRVWQENKANLDQFKEAEMETRKKIANALGEAGKAKTSTITGTLPGENEGDPPVKVTFKVCVENSTNYNVSSEVTELIYDRVYSELAPHFHENDGTMTVEEAETALVQAVNATIESVLKYKPEVKIKGYKELPPNLKAIFDEFITTSPASPSVKVQEIEE